MSWMAWTLPTAVFFIVIASILVGMTVWEIRSPCIDRKGFLPIPPPVETGYLLVYSVVLSSICI